MQESARDFWLYMRDLGEEEVSWAKGTVTRRSLPDQDSNGYSGSSARAFGRDYSSTLVIS
jgi:hypothetical protein